MEDSLTRLSMKRLSERSNQEEASVSEKEIETDGNGERDRKTENGANRRAIVQRKVLPC